MKKATAVHDHRSLETQVSEVLSRLKRKGSKSTRDGMKRFGIPSANAFGVQVSELQKLAKDIGPDHKLAKALWQTGFYEARMLAAFLDDPAKVTATQMDRWSRDFDNWAIVDTLCFKLFDRTAHAWGKIRPWSKRQNEFQKRAAFALIASLGAHDKGATDDQFLGCLSMIEDASTDDRNFVKKGVSWALRVIGRRNQNLNKAAVKLAERLAKSSDPTARSLGKEALREFRNPAIIRRLSS